MAQIVWHEASFNYVFRSWPGPVGRHVNRIGHTTRVLSKAMAPKETTALANNIEVKDRFIGRDVSMDVGTNLGGTRVGYAIYTHESAAHIIRARRAPNLVFRVKPSGRLIVTKSVHWRLRNPANTKYMTRALRAAMRSG